MRKNQEKTSSVKKPAQAEFSVDKTQSSAPQSSNGSGSLNRTGV